jgi:hypothetical protein
MVGTAKHDAVAAELNSLLILSVPYISLLSLWALLLQCLQVLLLLLLVLLIQDSREVLALHNEGLILLQHVLCLMPLQQLLKLGTPATAGGKLCESPACSQHCLQVVHLT